MDFFYGAECPHCHDEMEFFPVLEKMYPDLVIKKYETWHNPENKKLAEKKLSELGETLEGVPTNIIARKVIVGFQKEKIIKNLETAFGKPSISAEDAENSQNTGNPAKNWIFVVLGLIILAGAGYAFSQNSLKK
jgi:LPXTG-motif cell wall-anchored protein